MHSSKEFYFDESSTPLENIDRVGTLRIIFELPSLESRYISEGEIDIEEEATAEEPDIFASDSV